MTFRLKSLALGSLATAILFATIACSRNTDNLLETIPADVDYIAVVDARSLADKIEIKVVDGNLTLPPAIAQRLRQVPETTLATVGKLYEAVEMNSVVVFGEYGDDARVTFRIADPDMLAQLLEGYSSAKKSGYELTALQGGLTLAVKGEQGWLVRSSNAADEIDDVLKSASKGAVSSIEGVAQALEGEHPMRMAFNVSSGEKWLTATVDIDRQIVKAVTHLIKSDGEVLPPPGLQTLSTDFLRYTPPTANFACALGATPETDWNYIGSLLSSIPDPQINGLLGTVLPYLEKADGTVALAASVEPDDLTSSGRDFILMVHMPQSEISVALAEVKSRMESMGMTPHADHQGVLSVVGNGMGLYAGDIDGYLALSSRPFNPTENNQLNTYFLSRQAVVVLNLPRLPFINPTMGLTLTLEVETEMSTLTIKTSGTVVELVGTLLSFVI